MNLQLGQIRCGLAASQAKYINPGQVFSPVFSMMGLYTKWHKPVPYNAQGEFLRYLTNNTAN